jgi:P-type Ca2+ transporter type 2C
MGKRMNGLDMAGTSGLSELEATERLRLEGANELPTTKPRTVWHIALEVIREPMFLLLILAGTIYFVLGDIGEGVMLLGFVVVVMGITMYQERKTERALEALRDLSSPRALVIRDHVPRRIAGREVVRDDILVLAEGDRIPADALLISDLHLSVDESLLTGESVAVNKLARADSLEFARPSGDGTPFLFSGTLVVQGEGLARVVATGSRTELGKIGTALQTVNVESTTLKLETDRLVRLILVVLGYGLLRGHWLEGLLAGIALAMALLPEEIPVILTVFMALGAWRIAQHQVLTRRAQVIETLGSATVLCVDKTGTLTQNRMTVAGIATNHERCDVTHSRRFPKPFTPRSSLAFWPAIRVPSIRWNVRWLRPVIDCWSTPSTCMAIGTSCVNTHSRQRCWRSRTSGGQPMAAAT